jgi:hypothetical protein
MSGECRGIQLLRPAQGRPNEQGRPFYNRLRQHCCFNPLAPAKAQSAIFGRHEIFCTRLQRGFVPRNDAKGGAHAAASMSNGIGLERVRLAITRIAPVPRTGNEVSMDSLEKSLDWLFPEEPRSGLSA